jgi:hypothetical protein
MTKYFVWALKCLVWLIAVSLLLAAAWFASNNRWVDASPADVPAALSATESPLPPARNGFFALAGLDAPVGVDPAAFGQQRWVGEVPASMGSSLAWPHASTSGWRCDGRREDCLTLTPQQAAALSQGLQAHAEIGARCEALASAGFEMDERLPEPLPQAQVVANPYALPQQAAHEQNAGQCARWLRAQTALALQRDDMAGVQQALARSAALTQGLLAGSHSLMANLIAWRLAQEHWQTVVGVAAARPALAPAMHALILPLPAAAQDPARWIAAEAQAGRQQLRDLDRGCALAHQPDCKPSLWAMPQASEQLFNAYWTQVLSRAAGSPLNLLDWPLPNGDRRLFGLAWRNTEVQHMLDVAALGYGGDAKEQADLLLQHRAAQLALQAAELAPAQRGPAWLAGQPIDARLRERLRLESGQVVAQGWAVDPFADKAMPVSYPIPVLNKDS